MSVISWLLLGLLWAVTGAFAVYYWRRLQRTPDWKKHPFSTKVELLFVPAPVLVGVIAATAAIYPALSAIDLTRQQQQRDLRRQIEQTTHSAVRLYAAFLTELERVYVAAITLEAATERSERSRRLQRPVSPNLPLVLEQIILGMPLPDVAALDLQQEDLRVLGDFRLNMTRLKRQQGILAERLRAANEALIDIVQSDFAFACYRNMWDDSAAASKLLRVYRAVDIDDARNYAIMSASGLIGTGIARLEDAADSDAVTFAGSLDGVERAMTELPDLGTLTRPVETILFLSTLLGYVPRHGSYMGVAALTDLVNALPDGGDVTACANTYYEDDDDFAELSGQHMVRFRPTDFAPLFIASLKEIDDSGFCYVAPCPTSGAGEVVAVGNKGLEDTILADEVKWYRFTIEETRRYVVQTSRGDGGAAVDTIIRLFDGEREPVGMNDDGGNEKHAALHEQLSPGEYQLAVWTFSGAAGGYRVSVATEND